MADTYKILRFNVSNTGRPVTIKRGLTLEEARAHCAKPGTRGGSTAKGTAWMEGYTKE